MARDNRVRLFDGEVELVDEAAERLWGEDAAEEIPRGKTIARLAEEYNEDDDD